MFFDSDLERDDYLAAYVENHGDEQLLASGPNPCSAFEGTPPLADEE